MIFKSDYVIGPIDTFEKIDIRPKTLLYEVSGQLADGSSCTLEAEFAVAIPAHEDRVLRAARALGVERASSQQELEELYRFPLIETVQTVLTKCTPEKISKESELIRQTLLEVAPFCLEDCGFETQSVEIRKVRFHKKVGKSWTP